MAYRKLLDGLSTIPFRRIQKYAQSLFLRDSIRDLTSCDVLIFSHDVNRNSRWEGQPFSPLTDNVSIGLSEVGLKTAQVSFFGSRQTLVYPNTNVYLMNRSFLRAFLVDLFWSLLTFRNRSVRGRFEAIERLFSQTIERSKAKLILTVGVPKPLATAARRANIRLIEVLHGFGYSPLPWDYADRKASELPHEFWLADPLSLETFKELETKGVANTLISPLQLVRPEVREFLATQNGSSNSNPQVAESDFKSNHEKIKVLVVLSRGGYFGQKIDGRVEDWHLLERLVIDSSDEVVWHFRLHPMQTAEGKSSPTFQGVRRLEKNHENCDWEWATFSTPGIIYPEIDCVLTWGSEAVFDAFYSGLKSGVILPGSFPESEALGKHRALDMLHKQDFLTFLPPNAQEIRQWVKKQRKAQEVRIEPGAEDLAALVRRCEGYVRSAGELSGTEKSFFPKQ